MSKLGIVGIVLGVVGLISLIAYLVKKQVVGKDAITGVDNDKIKKAAESAGIPTVIAEKIAAAPDSAKAACSVGVNPVLATTIANGITVSNPGPTSNPQARQNDGRDSSRCDCVTGKVVAHYTGSDGKGYELGTSESCNCGGSSKYFVFEKANASAFKA